MCSTWTAVMLVAAVSACGGTPLVSSAPGIEIIPAAFSDTDKPKYIILGNTGNAVSNDIQIEVPTATANRLQETLPAIIVRQNQQLSLQQQTTYQQQPAYQQQPVFQQQPVYQQQSVYQQHSVYRRPQPIYPQQIVYQQQPVYASMPYISGQYYRTTTPATSNGFFDTVAMALGLRSGSSRPSQATYTPAASSASPFSLGSLLNEAFLLG